MKATLDQEAERAGRAGLTSLKQSGGGQVASRVCSVLSVACTADERSCSKAAAVAERLVTRAGMRTALSADLLVGTAGMVLLALTLSPRSPLVAVLPGIMVTGFGMGIVWTSMWVAAGNGVAVSEQGVASGMASVTHRTGLAVGTALMALIANAGIGGLNGDALRQALTHGLSMAYYLAAGVTLLGVLVTGVALGRRHRSESGDPRQGQCTASTA
ncbi:MFS family permease [Streptosporangium album]|uniref:MFS family permease n=1 Tax=Streptosporangium album TaxID=47479 RepID=A0A7W7S508_9ACTN|nr:hypothetical protein [Streptosporangium album]MBB4943642.1 MFS family permease [Streptosporangium album]